MPKKPARRSQSQGSWKPDSDTIVASLISAAVLALDAYGGRPEIRGVRSDVGVDDMTLSMFGHLERDDFPSLNETIETHIAPDPALGTYDTRGIALQLLLDALSLKETLSRYRARGAEVDLDSLLWELSKAEATHGELREAYSFAFARNRLQWIRSPGQSKGREEKKRAMAARNATIQQMAGKYKREREKGGKRPASNSQTARDVRRQFALALRRDDGAESLPSEKRFRDIIRGSS